MHGYHEPQYQVNPRDLQNHLQLISLSDTYPHMAKLWADIQALMVSRTPIPPPKGACAQ